MTDLHFVILAAGVGSRIASEALGRPKWLLDVNRSRIADRQLDAIRQISRDVDVASVTVVSGHRSDLIESFVDGVAGLDVRVLYNARYESCNNWYSLLLGLQALELRESSRVVVVNSDLCASAGWLTTVLASLLAAPGEALAVDCVRPLTAEAMKVGTKNVRGRSVLQEVAKCGLRSEPRGEYVGLLAMSAFGARTVLSVLQSFEGDENRRDEWYEAAIAISAGVLEWRIAAVPDSHWTEIDDVLDLRAAGVH